MNNFGKHIIKGIIIGNVTQVTSICPWLNGQSLTETFTYDASDQLVSAAETQAQSYQLAVTYGNWGKVSGYSLLQTELWSGSTTHDHRSFAYPNDPYNPQQAQTMFAPETHNGTSDVTYTFGINGSLRKREEHSPNLCTEYFLFNSAANLKAYSCDALDFAYYGYNAANTRTYKLSMLNMNQWVNGEPQPIQLQMQQAMFYPNAYINFNQNGEYTKHYYNGSERIASRLGDMTAYIYAEAGERLENRIMRLDALFREELGGMLAYEEPEQPAILGNRNGGTRELVSPPVEYEPFLSVSSLQPTGTPDDIFYYHMNHLGSTAFVTDQNQNVTQGFLYAPFGEITTEYAPLWQNGTLPKYSFNAKELDEETGMYYYEARYYKPPVFTSRDPMFEKYFWTTPYAYCANNPVKYVDPDGREIIIMDGNKSYYYVNGHVYLNKKGRGLIFDSALGKEASKIKNNLDEMRKDNAGAKVVGRLIKSEETYTIAADAKTGDGSYRASINKVSLVSGKLNNMESLSHELFHAYQDDNGRIPHTVYNEVEAYIFSGMMSGKPTMGMMSDKNPEYTKHANNMKKGFSNSSFNYLVSHFRRDSKANTLRGTYKSYEYNPGKYTISQSLLRNLYK